MELSTDRGEQLRVDQVLHPSFQESAEQVFGVSVAETTDQVGHSGIIVMRHRVVPSQ
jgi:hypothetical protein